jgi:23S rRNA pseudouridine955/2504/2580 synthase
MSSGDRSGRSSARTVEVDADAAGQRIDNFLMRELRGVPRARVYRLLRRGEVRINGGRIKPQRRLSSGDRVRIPPVQCEQFAEGRLPPGLMERLRTAVLYEDDSMLAVDKPAGVAVHGGTGLGGGLIDGLRALRPDIDRLDLVHRLDRDTSGCVLLAKGRPALKRLQAALRAGRFDKVYRAVLLGDWGACEQWVHARLRRDRTPSGERIVRVDGAGRLAASHFRRVSADAGATEVEVTIDTGRTHQIRVHARHMGLPVAGDTKYGDAEAERALWGRRASRLMLHAQRLSVPTADGPVTIESAVPAGLGWGGGG